MAESNTRVLAAVAALIALIAAALFVLSSKGDSASSDRGESPSAEAAPPSTQGTPTAERPLPKARIGKQPHARKLANKAARQRLLEALDRARKARLAAARAERVPTDKGSAPALTATLDKDYIRTTVREVVPLIKECYELALAEKADLAGKLIVGFTIEGEEEIGGVVTTADIQADDESPLGKNQTLSECVRETVMSLAFVAPKGGGKVTVRYPFIFRSDGGGASTK